MSDFYIDVRMISTSGIGTYIKNLVPLVIEKLPHMNIRLIGNQQELQRYSWTKNQRVTVVPCDAPIYSIQEQFDLYRIVPKDTVLWVPHYNIPVFRKGKMIVTIHDVLPLAMPQIIQGIHKKMYAEFMFNAVKRKANTIICVSNFTKDQLKLYTGISDKKITTIHLGVERAWFGMQKSQISPYNKPYILYVGNVKPHKNLIRLIEAFDLIKGNIVHDLVVVGKKEGFITGDQLALEKASKIDGRVLFTGHVDDELLKQYFLHADMLIFPSLYEGFGLPPLEAMACGCPVIVSSSASLPEVCGDAAIYCDPNNTNDIAEKILLVINDPGLKEKLRRKGIEHASRFSWENCAEETCGVIEKVISC